MADFKETSVSRNAKRSYTAPIATLEQFEAVVAAFAADSTMGITVQQTAASYKSAVVYFDENSNENGSVTLYAEDKTQFENLKTFLAGDIAAEAANGENHGEAPSDSADDNWSVKFSCANTVGETEDTFTVTIAREYMNVSGFSLDETKTAIETWADSQDALA